MPFIHVNLTIDKVQLLRWYAGGVSQVSTKAIDGRSVRFPVALLRPFVQHDGIQGRFSIEFTTAGKFVAITRRD